MARKQKHNYSDRELIELFVERVEKLRNNSLIREGRLERLTFDFFSDPEDRRFEILDASGVPLNSESFDSLVMAFRLMYLPDEPTNMRTVRKVLRSHCPPERLQTLETFGKNWNRALEEHTHLHQANGKFVTLDELLKNYLHGVMFHSDKEKREFLNKWGRFSQAQFVFAVNFLLPYIFWLGDIAKQALEQQWMEEVKP